MYSIFENIKIKAISTCSPSTIERNEDLHFDKESLVRMIAYTGIEERKNS